MSLISMVYLSAASHLMSADELLEILHIARRNNSERNVTGMLLYRNGYFMQALEGEKEDVYAIFEKIATDDRHHHVLTIYNEEIEQREFSEWTMGFNNLDGVALNPDDGYTPFLDEPYETNLVDHPDVAYNLMRRFRSNPSF